MSGEFAGTLRERVGIEKRLGDRDQLAGATGSYLYKGVAAASVMPLIDAGLVEAQSLSAMPRWNVTMRKRDDMSQKIRLTWRGKYLAVKSLHSDPREPAQMVLTCEEIR